MVFAKLLGALGWPSVSRGDTEKAKPKPKKPSRDALLKGLRSGIGFEDGRAAEVLTELCEKMDTGTWNLTVALLFRHPGRYRSGHHIPWGASSMRVQTK